MKRLTALLLLLCIALTVMPSMAAQEYLGNMQVVNCNEWVSLRETPSASAKRLVKVSLGAVVRKCQQYSDQWIYAEYDGYAGYILSKYLQPCEGVSVFSAMMITNCEKGADFYTTIGGMEPGGLIPANTILRNCSVHESGRVYAEYGDRCVFVDAEYVEAYTELQHYPLQLTLLCNLFYGEYDGPIPSLKADYADGFRFPSGDCSKYEQEDAGIPRAEFVLYSDTEVNNVHLFSVSLRSMDDSTGEAVFDATLEHIQPQVDPDHPLSVSAVIDGTMPNLAVGYEDPYGVYHFAFVEISGKDGSLLLQEF